MCRQGSSLLLLLMGTKRYLLLHLGWVEAFGLYSQYICWFQGPFSRLHYELIGDDSAPTYFAVNEENGEITTIRDLGETETEIFIVSN